MTTSAQETAQPKLGLAILEEFSTKTIVFGALDLGDMQIESLESIAGRLCEAFSYVPPELLMVAPDCGMKYLPRALAYQKLWAMTLGAAIVKEFIGSTIDGSPARPGVADAHGSSLDLVGR